MFYQKVIKGLLDRAFALLLLVLLSPLLLLTALVVRVRLGSPVLFRQPRPGKNGKIFRIVKFRTMITAFGADGKPLGDEARLTRTGRLIRSLSLDELPQLINVLRGEMSFVGPRPLLVEYLPRYNAFQAKRHSVKPGITGLAQINGRNAQSWRKRFEYDVFYADHLSFWLDALIMLKTVRKVIIRDGIRSTGSATKEPFLGNGDRLFVYGGGSHGRVIAQCAANAGYRVEGFIDDNAANGISYEQFLARAKTELFSVALGIGGNKPRREKALQLQRDQIRLATVIDPSAFVGDKTHIGAGAVVLPTAVINLAARIEEGAIINSGAVIEHNAVIGAYAHISCNGTVCGGARVGSLTLIGAGATVINLVSVGKESVIGAGACVTADLPPFVTAVGVPAKIIKGRQ